MAITIGDDLAARGVTQTVYMGSAPRMVRNGPWNNAWTLLDPLLAGPRTFFRRMGFVNVSIDNPAWHGAFAAELYSAGSAAGERLSPQALQELANAEDNPFHLAGNWRAYWVTPEDLADLEYAADPQDPSRAIFETQIADMLAAYGLPGPKTTATQSGGVGATGPRAPAGLGGSDQASPAASLHVIAPESRPPLAPAVPAADPLAAFIAAGRAYVATLAPSEAAIWTPVIDLLSGGGDVRALEAAAGKLLLGRLDPSIAPVLAPLVTTLLSGGRPTSAEILAALLPLLIQHVGG